MGWAMARNLSSKQYQVTVRDVQPEAHSQAARLGMRVAASPANLASNVDVVAIVVVNAAQIADVVSGTPDCPGLVESGKPGQIVLLCSTISPESTISFAEQLAARGMSAIDAPISGGPARALTGDMSMMLAGPQGALESIESLLADFAKHRFHLGITVGDASKAKLVNNLLAGINLAASAEAMALGIQLGLAPQTIFDIVSASSGNSWIFQDRMARAIREDYAPRAAAPVLTKDLGLATALAKVVKAQTPLGDTAYARFSETVDRGWAELDDAAILKTYLSNNQT
jgi:3-hydroxyisobutyrate dehydrogenase